MMTRRIITGLVFACSCAMAQQPFITEFPSGFNMQTNTLWTQLYQGMRDVVRGDVHTDYDTQYTDSLLRPWRSWFMSSGVATDRTATSRPTEEHSESFPAPIWFANYGTVLADGFDRTANDNITKNFINEWARNPYIGWHFRESQLWLERLAGRYGQLGEDMVFEPFGTWANLANVAGLLNNDWRRAVDNYPGFTKVAGILDFVGEYTSGNNIFDPTGRYYASPGNIPPDVYYITINDPFFIAQWGTGGVWYVVDDSTFETIAVNATGPAGSYYPLAGYSGVGSAEEIIQSIPNPNWDQWQYGRSVTGDIIGPWLFEDITKVADKMTLSHYALGKDDGFGTVSRMELPMFSFGVELTYRRGYTKRWLLGQADGAVPFIVHNSQDPDHDGLYGDFVSDTANQFRPSGRAGMISQFNTTNWYIHSWQNLLKVTGPSDHGAVGPYDPYLPQTDTITPTNPGELMIALDAGAEIESVNDERWRLSRTRDGIGRWEIWSINQPSLYIQDDEFEGVAGFYAPEPGIPLHTLGRGSYYRYPTLSEPPYYYLSKSRDEDDEPIWMLVDQSSETYWLRIEQETNGTPVGATGKYHYSELPYSPNWSEGTGFFLTTNGVSDTWEVWPALPRTVRINGEVTNVSPSTVIGDYVHAGGNVWIGPSGWQIEFVMDGDNTTGGFGIFLGAETGRQATNSYFRLDSPIYQTHDTNVFPSAGYAPAGAWGNSAEDYDADPLVFRSTGGVYSVLGVWSSADGPNGTYTPFGAYDFPSNTTYLVTNALFGTTPPVFIKKGAELPQGTYLPFGYASATSNIEVIRNGYFNESDNYWGTYTGGGLYDGTNLVAEARYYELLGYEAESIGEMFGPTNLFVPVDAAVGTPWIEDNVYIYWTTNGWGYFNDALLTTKAQFEATLDRELLTSAATINERDADMGGAFVADTSLRLPEEGERWAGSGYSYRAGLLANVVIRDSDPAMLDPDSGAGPLLSVYLDYTEYETVGIPLIATRSFNNQDMAYGAGARFNLPSFSSAYIDMSFKEGHQDEGDKKVQSVARNILYQETAESLGTPGYRDPLEERMMAFPVPADLEPHPTRPLNNDPLKAFHDRIVDALNTWDWYESYWNDISESKDVDCPIDRYLIQWDRKFTLP